MKQLSLLLLLGAALVTASPIKPQPRSPRISNDDPAVLGQFPWQTLVFFWQDYPTLCSGALIDPSWVLTTATCVFYGGGDKYFSLHFGTVEYGTTDVVQNATKTIIHENFDFFVMQDDIALIYIDEPIVPGDNINFIPVASHEVDDGTALTVVGFGLVSDSDQVGGKLRFGRVQTLPREMCVGVYGEQFVHNSTLCVVPADTHTELCAGDIGSSLVLDADTSPALVGLAIWTGSPYCGREQLPDGYISAVEYRDWISDNMSTQ